MAQRRRGTDKIAKAAGALELFHAFALAHDDVIDNSDTRRGHVREVIKATGALEAVEGMIDDLATDARIALERTPVHPTPRRR